VSLVTGHYEFEIQVTTSSYSGDHAHSITILRRFNEIIWLHEQLLAENPGCRIPTPPDKNFWLNMTVNNTQLVEERKKQIEEYLNFIAKHKYLSQNAKFRNFCFDEQIALDSGLLDKFVNFAKYLKNRSANRLPGLDNINTDPNIDKERYRMLKTYHTIIKEKGLLENMVN
jgi:hypothetical protein